MSVSFEDSELVEYEQTVAIPEVLSVMSIFYNWSSSNREDIISKNRKMIYYTRAATAVKILDRSEIWMRSPEVMNDKNELRYGYELIVNNIDKFDIVKMMDSVDKSFSKILRERIIDNFDYAYRNSFTASLSVHSARSIVEENYGRLSMWRAYGGDSGIAFILNNKIFVTESKYEGLYSNPVIYCDIDTVVEKINQSLRNDVNILEHVNCSVKRTIFMEGMVSLFCNMAMSVKHPAFEEEDEWRIVYDQNYALNNAGILLKREVEVIGSVAQEVIKLNLSNLCKDHGVDIKNDLIEKILIGPTDFPFALESAIKAKLGSNGFKPITPVIPTFIPLRI